MNNIAKAIAILFFYSAWGFCSSETPLKELKNNYWYKYTDSDTAIVFVHGIFGNSSETWRYHNNKDSSRDMYWPKMISEDSRFGNVSIYLGGYATSFDSGKYGAPEASKELWNALSTNNYVQNEKPVLEKDKIVFVCHSTGGIIARHALVHHREAFKDKAIGLVLIASPSYGSKWANNLNAIINFYDNDLAKILKEDSDFLEQLDDDFKDMKDANLLPYLVGSEALEHHFIIHHWLWPDDEVLVSKSSGGRYFSAPEILPNTDHFSTVKPNDLDHPGYRFLSNFYFGKFKDKIIEKTETDFSNLVNEHNYLGIKFQ
jgi:pimeloyl-ACP methyl ester carboxylesterase